MEVDGKRDEGKHGLPKGRLYQSGQIYPNSKLPQHTSHLAQHVEHGQLVHIASREHVLIKRTCLNLQ